MDGTTAIAREMLGVKVGKGLGHTAAILLLPFWEKEGARERSEWEG